MNNDPFELSNATIKDEQHVLVTRQAARGGAHCTYWKVFQAGLGRDAAYWTDRENRLIAGLWAKSVKRVVKLHAMTSQTPRPDASPVTEHIATFDAGLTVWQWLQQRPRYADGTVAAHPFQAIGALLALASACLDALHNIHAAGYVHLDLRADNICLLYRPYPFRPGPGERVTLDFDRLALIDFAFSISRDNPLKHPLPILPTGFGQSRRLRQALQQDRDNADAGTIHADRLDWRCDLVSLGHMLDDIMRRDGLWIAPWPGGLDDLDGLIMPPDGPWIVPWMGALDALGGLRRLIKALYAYDEGDGPAPAELPHRDWIAQIEQWRQGLADDGRYASFTLADADTPVRPPIPTPTPTPVPVPIPIPPRPSRWRHAKLGLALLGAAGLGWGLAQMFGGAGEEAAASCPNAPACPAPPACPSVSAPNCPPPPPPPPPKPATLPRDLPKACAECPEMVELPQGEFMMGSPVGEKERDADEGPQHKVTIDYPLAVGKYEVTFAEWDACERDNNACPHAADQGWGRDKRPVINVSWDDAQKYVAWLNGKAKLSEQAKNRYRLLNEAEWEYAARAVARVGPSAAYWWGDSASHEYANYGKDVCCGGLAQGRDQWEHTAPVGSFPANPWHLQDMHGNVREWVQDCYDANYNNAPDNGSAWEDGASCDGRRVLRGGSWFSYPQFLRSADRDGHDTGDRGINLGFRLARTLTP